MTKKQVKKILALYFEGLANRVENDTLSFKEGFAIFFLGGVFWLVLKGLLDLAVLILSA